MQVKSFLKTFCSGLLGIMKFISLALFLQQINKIWEEHLNLEKLENLNVGAKWQKPLLKLVKTL